MDLHMLSLGTLVSKRNWCVFQGTKFTEVWHIMWLFAGSLIWYHTHKHTQRHTAHLGDSRLAHPNKYIFTPPVMCSQHSVIYYIKWITHWYQKFTFHNVFSFQKLFISKTHISAD